MDPAHQKHLYDELRTALDKTRPEDIKRWGQASARRLPQIAARRVKNLGRLMSSISKAAGRELAGAFKAWGQGRFGDHLGNRAAGGIDQAIVLAKRTATTVGTMGKALLDDPKKSAPDVFALALGFYAGSGGLDGNGGIPDSDLALGIEWHRSVLTHSIIAGTVVEGAILSLADLAGIVCEQLPQTKRDPFWDRLVEAKNRISSKLVSGTSAGISYHLAVDAVIQPAAYHDLMVPMPIEVHQALMGANALAEGLDAVNKRETTGEKVVSAVKTGGRIALSSVANAKEFMAGLMSGDGGGKR